MNTPEGFEVRRATVADAAELARLRYQFRAGRAQLLEDEGAFVARAEAWMREHLPGDRWHVWVLEEDATVAGSVWLQIIEKLPNPAAEFERHAYVTNFFVRPESRGKGAGSMMLSILKQDCEALEIDTIFLWPSDESRTLYARHGFGPAAEILTFKR